MKHHIPLALITTVQIAQEYLGSIASCKNNLKWALINFLAYAVEGMNLKE
jgi:hypothetical protein